MNTGPVRSGAEKALQKPGPFIYFGLLPVLVLLALIIGFRLLLHSVVIYEPLLLLPVLNTVFLFLVGCLIAYSAWRSYLQSGATSILWLGCGCWLGHRRLGNGMTDISFRTQRQRHYLQCGGILESNLPYCGGSDELWVWLNLRDNL